MAKIDESVDEDAITLTVMRQRAGENPSIPIYHVTIRKPLGEWTDMCGTTHDLQVWLKGFEAGISMDGYWGLIATWDIPENWMEPTGKRWVFTKGSIADTCELDSEGSVIERP